jgi:Holliday junction DNA helicase RuvA
MIVAIEGALQSRGADFIVVKVGSISVQVYAPTSTLVQFGDIGSTVFLHTFLYIKEDSVALYGFSSIEALELFKSLITVSGIGPKTALGLLSVFSPEHLVSAIVGGNVKLLCQAPGLGRKMAERIVLELRGKLEKNWGETLSPALLQEDADVVAALVSLGYSLREATQAVSALAGSSELSLEDKIKLALKQLASV